MTAADNQQLRQVRAAILGNRPDTSLSNAMYPVYVAVIAAGSYGVPAAQQLFRSLDGKWLAAHAWTPLGASVLVVVAALLLAMVRLVGRVHGPVVPPLPYLELVVASPMPRKVTLARNWRLSLGGSVIGGLLVGLVAGAGLAIANVTSPQCFCRAVLAALWSDCWLPSSGCRVRCMRPRWGCAQSLHCRVGAETRWHCWTSLVSRGSPPAMPP